MEGSMDSLESPASLDEMKLRYEEVLSQLCLIGRLNESVALMEDLPELCLSIVDSVIEFTPAENCSIMLYDPESRLLNLFVAKGRHDSGSFHGADKMPTTIIRTGEGAAGWAVENEEIVQINDCQADSRFIELASATKKVNSVICAPIISDGSVLGIINCSHPRKQQFGEVDKQIVAHVADHAAVLFNKALMIDQLKKKNRKIESELKEKDEALSQAETTVSELGDRLHQSDKFATLGELLAGVAHEISNRLAPILIYSQMLHQSANDEQNKKRLHVIEESAMGAKTILETLLSYSRPGLQEHRAVNLNQTLQSALTLMEYKTRNHGIDFSLDLCPELPPTEVNEKKIAQVFLNIIGNAIAAMENNGGKLDIKTGFDRDKVVLTISDTGPGIPDELADRVFEPFFTTKESGKGTGLGLSISRQYLKEHGGAINIDTSSSCGATFIVEIPRTGTNGDTPAKKTDASSVRHENPARILVVDDDSTICDVIRDVLGSGYEVDFATDGQDATEKIERGPFDLLVVDYHMPSFDGKQLYEWIENNHPALKQHVVFSTGDTYRDDIREFIEGTGCRYLIKPFSTKKLREVVAGTLKA